MLTPLPWREDRCTVGTYDLAWRAAGSGPPVVYLHDAGADTLTSPVFDDLAADHHVVVVDLPGYGRSPAPAGMRTVAEMAVLLTMWLDQQGLAPATLVGTSLGGWFAAEAAAAEASCAAGLVLLDAAGLHTPHSYLFDLFVQGAAAGAVSHRVATSLRRRIPAGERAHANQPGALGGALVGPWVQNLAAAAANSWNPATASPALLGRLRRITAPTVVLWGEHDALIPLAHARAFAAAIPGARLQIVPGAGHLLALEHPTLVTAAVRSLTLALPGSV